MTATFNIKKRSARNSIDWDAALRLFITENLKPDRKRTFTYREVAKAFNTTQGYVNRYAAEHNWRAILKQEKLKLHDKTIDTMREQSAFKEAEYRMGVVKVGQAMIEKGMARIAKLNPQTLTVKEAAELARLGHELVVQAAGIDTTSPIPPADLNVLKPGDDGYLPVVASEQKANRLRFLAAQLNKFVESKQG